MNFFKSVGEKLFGGRSDSGILGTGQFRSKEYEVKDGAFDSKETQATRQSFGDALRNVQGRSAATMNTGASDQWRGRQTALADNLNATINGQTPSVAQMQMQRGVNQSLANANSLAAGSRGVSPAFAMRLAQQQQAAASQDAVGQGAILRAQEQAQARGELAGVLNQARGQDMQIAQNNLEASMQQRNLNDQRERFLREGVMTMDERNRQAAIDRERMKSQNAIGYNQINSGAYQAAAQNRAGAVGGIASGIAGIVAGAGSIFSDEKLKTGIQPMKFSSPTDSSFKATIAAPDDGEKNFEPTREEATKKRKEDVRKFLSDNSGKGSGHEQMGKGFAALGMALSDEKKKEGKAEGGGRSKAFLDSIKAYTYKYKDPAHGEGQQIGVMAQDLEKTPEGKSLVVDTPEGKMVNYGKASGLMMANQAMLNSRLNEIEKAFAIRQKRERSA